VQADAKNIDALKQIGAQDFQVAVVAVGRRSRHPCSSPRTWSI
jgi:Trk K+ transport system NAD-binding subunit